MKQVFVKYTFLLALTCIAITSSSFQKERLLISSQNLLKKTVPFKGKFILSLGAVGVSGAGTASHIGRFGFYAQFTGAITGISTFTAANGDQIFTTFTVLEHLDIGNGMVQAAFDYTITGGTGRFVGATGSFVINALINENVGTGSAKFDGMISY